MWHNFQKYFLSLLRCPEEWTIDIEESNLLRPVSKSGKFTVAREEVKAVPRVAAFIQFTPFESLFMDTCRCDLIFIFNARDIPERLTRKLTDAYTYVCMKIWMIPYKHFEH